MMSGDSYSHRSRRHSDRYYRDDHYHRNNRYHRDDSRHYDYRRSRDRDSRDNYRNENHQRRVPGSVTDPDSHFGDVDKAIQRGQRETVNRVQSGRTNYYKPAKTTTPTLDYKNPIATITKSHYRSSYPDTDSKKSRKYFYNASFLSFIPGLAGFALIVAAVVLPGWIIGISFSATQSAQINYRGLFSVCLMSFTSEASPVDDGCMTLEEFTSQGSLISTLEQATRGLIIIAAVLGFVAVVVSFVLGLRKLERAKGAYIIGGVYAFSAACGTAGMGCYSAIIRNTEFTDSNTTESLAGTPFYLGWFGVGLLFVASLIAFMGHCAKKRN